MKAAFTPGGLPPLPLDIGAVQHPRHITPLMGVGIFRLGLDLRPIPYSPAPITPLPEVVETNTDSGWAAWDLATMLQDIATADAARTAQQEAP